MTSKLLKQAFKIDKNEWLNWLRDFVSIAGMYFKLTPLTLFGFSLKSDL